MGGNHTDETPAVKSRFLLCCVLALGTADFRCTREAGDPQPLYEAGIAKYAVADYRGAVRDFTDALFAAPEYHQGYFLRGIAYSKLGAYSSAIDDFSDAIACCNAQRDSARADTDCPRIDLDIVLDDRLTDVPARTSPSLVDLLVLDTAIPPGMTSFADTDTFEWFAACTSTKIILSDVDVGTYHRFRGNAREMMLGVARDEEQSSVEDSTVREYYHAYLHGESSPEVIMDYSRAIDAQPHNGINFLLRGAAYYKDGRYDEALRDFTYGLRSSYYGETRFEVTLHFLRYFAYSALGRSTKAQSERRRAESEFFREALEKVWNPMTSAP